MNSERNGRDGTHLSKLDCKVTSNRARAGGGKNRHFSFRINSHRGWDWNSQWRKIAAKRQVGSCRCQNDLALREKTCVLWRKCLIRETSLSGSGLLVLTATMSTWGFNSSLPRPAISYTSHAQQCTMSCCHIAFLVKDSISGIKRQYTGI